MTKNIFRLGKEVSHPREELEWKIECGVLTERDYETIVHIIVEEWKLQFKKVVFLGENGDQFAAAVLPFIQVNNDNYPILIVDDVLTTGKSMVKAMLDVKQCYECEVIGVVIFALGECPKWIRPIFSFSG